MTTNLEIIKEAIEKEKSISCIYDGLHRKLSPYILGLKKRSLQCLFYQYGGKSKSRSIDGISKKNWRCLKLTKLSNIKILDEPLHKPLVISHKKKVHVLIE